MPPQLSVVSPDGASSVVVAISVEELVVGVSLDFGDGVEDGAIELVSCPTSVEVEA